MSRTPSSGQARVNAKRTQRAALWAHQSDAPQMPHVIWAGDTGQIGTAYEAHVIAWLFANGVNGNLVDACQPITAAAGEIRYTRILLIDDKPYAILPGVPATVTGVAPLVVPFESPVTT